MAALLPPDWELRLADLNIRSLTEQDWHWADLILISAMYIQRAGLLALVREAKRRGKTVVAGGPHPTSFPEAVLEAGCDYVVRGEGENTIPLLLEAMKDGRTGVIQTEEKPDLATSPIPRFDLVRLDDYDGMTIQTSRGCPYDCEFCDVVRLFGRKPRYKTPKQVLAELEALHQVGASGTLFFCDDNFIGNKAQARALLKELIPWLKSRGAPFNFLTQASVNLGQDPEMIDLLTEANFGKVFIGIESPDEKVLETSHKYHNIKNPLLESLNNINKKGITVLGSFILGLDGETKGAGERICSFMEETAIPIAMLGVLQAAPHTKLWHRLEREGRLRVDEGDDAGTLSPPNFVPERPEAEIMQEYVDAWDYLYEPSRYLARTYRYYLAMRPTRLAMAKAAGTPLPKSVVPKQPMTWRQKLVDVRAFFRILWCQGIRPPYRGQFLSQLIGILRKNPSRFMPYVVTCAMGEDLFYMRKVVREKFTSFIKARQLEVPAVQSRPGAAPQGGPAAAAPDKINDRAGRARG